MSSPNPFHVPDSLKVCALGVTMQMALIKMQMDSICDTGSKPEQEGPDPADAFLAPLKLGINGIMDIVI